MNYVKQPEEKKSCLSRFFILFLFLVIIVVIVTISINVVKNNQPRYSNSDPIKDPATIIEQPIEIPNRVLTFLLLGSDYRPDEGARTDVIILAAVNLKDGKVNLLSFPRDMWIPIPGWDSNRINAAYIFGGIDLLNDTLEYNFGFRPEKFAMVDFEGFVKIVDILGGIDINASTAMEDRCDLNATGWCRVEPGITHMDGQTALWYARARYATSDFDRTRRAQEVIKALAQKSVSFNTLIKSGKLFDTFGDYVDTNVTTVDLLPFITKIGTLTSTDAITSYYITENEAYSYFTAAGANVLVPDMNAIRLILDEVLFITTP